MGIWSNLWRTVLVGFKTDGSGLGEVKTSTDGGLIVNQNTVVDVGNSSTANLAVGASFIGATTSDLNYTAVQFSLKTDQDCAVFIDQSPDGINWDVIDPFDVFANVGSGNSILLINSYYRVRVTNVGFATTTYFRLQTISVPFTLPLPRSLNQDGHLQVSNYGFQDHYGTNQYLAPNGEIVAVPLYKLVGDTFNYSTLDTTTWFPTVVGSGTGVATSGELVLSTGVTANSSALVESLDIARFTGLSPNKLRQIVRLPDTGVANNVREWGVDSLARDNGAFFRLSGSTFSIVTKKASVETVVSSGSFNGQYGATFAPGLVAHFYEIITQPRQVVFLANNKIIHTINAQAAPWTETMHFHIHYGNTNSGGSTTNVTMYSRLGVISRFGIPEAQPRNTLVTGITAGTVIKYGPGDFHGITLSAIANNSAITVYDNIAASGKVLFSSGAMPPNTTPVPLDFMGSSFNIGLTVVIATASSNVNILYD